MRPSAAPNAEGPAAQIAELQKTMIAAQNQLRPFCLAAPPRTFLGSSWLYVLTVCIRPFIKKVTPTYWSGFYIELARLGGPSGVLTMLTIARLDACRDGDVTEAELEAFQKTAANLVANTCDALQTNAVVASLLFAATFQTVIGRPNEYSVYENAVDVWGEGVATVLLCVSASCMCLISILCLVIICYAFGSRMELQNVLPSTEAKLFYMCEVNPMNMVTAMTMTNMMLFFVLSVTGGMLAMPDGVKWLPLLMMPLIFLCVTRLWSGMRNGPVRLRLEARAFLDITNTEADFKPMMHKKGLRAQMVKDEVARAKWQKMQTSVKAVTITNALKREGNRGNLNAPEQEKEEKKEERSTRQSKGRRSSLAAQVDMAMGGSGGADMGIANFCDAGI